MTDGTDRGAMSSRPLLAVALAAALLCGAEPALAGQHAVLEIPVSGADVRRAASSHDWFDCRRRPCWDFEAGLPAWIPGVTGTMAEGSVRLDPEEDQDGNGIPDLFDSASKLQFAFVGALAVQHGRWSLSFDSFGASVGGGITFRLADGPLVDGEMGAILVRGRLGYEIDRRPLWLFGRPACLTTSLYAGARYHYVRFGARLPLGIGFDTSRSWWDPLVGVEAQLLWRRWGMRLLADVGGFDVNARSAVWLSGELEYRFTHSFSIFGGYAYMDVDFSEGAVRDRFVWNVRLRGPVLGLRFRF